MTTPQQNAPEYFKRDNFSTRRTTGHNMYDPESLLTGAEMAKGLDYHDKRVWPDLETYQLAVEGKLNVRDIPMVAPRRRTLYAVFGRVSKTPLVSGVKWSIANEIYQTQLRCARAGGYPCAYNPPEIWVGWHCEPEVKSDKL